MRDVVSSGSRGKLIDRRRFLRTLGFGAAAIGLGAACQAPAAQPTAVPAAPPTTAPAPKPTTAPAAAAPTTPPAPAATAAPAAQPTQAPAAVAAGTPKQGGSLRAAVGFNPSTLDAHASRSGYDRHYFYSVYNNLVGFDKDLNIVPELAESWDITNPTTIVFKLRKGVKFHDGTDFDAAAVKFNMDRVLNKDNNLIQRGDLQIIQSVDAVDSSTVKFNLASPAPYLFASLADRAGMIMSPAALQKEGKDYGRRPVGTGPYQFVEWVQDSSITMKRNPSYWEKGLPAPEQVTYRIMPDAAVRLTAIKTGEVDVIDSVLPKDVAGVKADGNLIVSEARSNAPVYVIFNSARPQLSKPAAREAVAWAIDPESVIKGAYFGLAKPALQTWNIPGSWAHDPNRRKYTRNVAKAKEKLAEAGVPNGFKFDMMVYNSFYTQVAQIYQAQLAEVGIQLSITTLEVGAYSSKNAAGDFDSLTQGYPEKGDPHEAVLTFMHSKGRWHTHGWTNPEYDALVDKGGSTFERDARKQAYSQAEAIVEKEVPMFFLVYEPEFKVMRNYVKGFLHVPDTILHLKTVWLDK